MLRTEIEGLYIWNDYISEKEEKALLESIDSQEWSTELTRRTQHYGARYCYKSKKLFRDVEPIPVDYTHLMLKYNLARATFPTATFDSIWEVLNPPFVPEQIIVNEYLVGQGISQHVDSKDCFAETILSLSLGSQTTMIFENLQSKVKKSFILQPRSLLIMEDEAREFWAHSIPATVFDGKIKRTRRVSLTFREILKSSKVEQI